MSEGFIKTPRSLFESFLWGQAGRLHPWEAYHDLLRRATYYRSTVRIHGREVTLNPGQTLCSTVNLATEWSWHRSTVHDFLRALEVNGLCDVDTENRVTILTLHPNGDGSRKNMPIEECDKPAKCRPSGRATGRSTDAAPAHSNKKDSSLNSPSDSKKEVLESGGPLCCPEFTEFMLAAMLGPNRIKLSPEFLPRVRAAYLDKLISEGRLNPAEKDRILLS